MAARGYEFYLLVLKVSLKSERSERVRDTLARENKIRITKRKLIFSVPKSQNSNKESAGSYLVIG